MGWSNNPKHQHVASWMAAMALSVGMVLGVLVATIILLVSEVVSIDVVAISCMLTLGWTGILTPLEMFSGFSSNALIAMLSMMILGRGIARTGIMDGFSKYVISKAGTRKKRLEGLLSLSTGFMSGLIQNIGAAALFLPGIMQVSRRTKIPPSSLIMPIGFAAILGGTLTIYHHLHKDRLLNLVLKSVYLLFFTNIFTASGNGY